MTETTDRYTRIKEHIDGLKKQREAGVELGERDRRRISVWDAAQRQEANQRFYDSLNKPRNARAQAEFNKVLGIRVFNVRSPKERAAQEKHRSQQRILKSYVEQMTAPERKNLAARVYRPVS